MYSDGRDRWEIATANEDSLLRKDRTLYKFSNVAIIERICYSISIKEKKKKKLTNEYHSIRARAKGESLWKLKRFYASSKISREGSQLVADAGKR